MAKLNIHAFVAFLEECAARKDGYIMGTLGQDPKKLSSWYYDQYTGSQRKKALYWREHAKRVWDCQGLAEGYINDQTGSHINLIARNNYALWCNPKGTGSIPTKYRVPGAAVFIYSKSAGAITHVGYLVRPVKAGKPEGDWYVVEAEPRDAFSDTPADLWEVVLRRQRDNLALVAFFPDDPSMN